MTAHNGKIMLRTLFAGISTLLSLGSSAHPEPFQAKDRINIIVGYEPGGGYDAYGRFVGRFLAKHIANKPSMVVQNMPGAGSLRAANHIYNIAPKDGTTIGIVGQSLPLMQLLDTPGIMFESDRFSWLARVSDLDAVLGVWSSVNVQSIEELKQKEIVVAIGGALSGSDLYPLFLNKLVGTKIKSVAGYSAREQFLALERGEIDGSFGLVYSQMLMQHPTWISDSKIRLLVQVGVQRRPSLPDVPTLAELAKSDEDRRILSAISGGDIIGRSFIAPPDTEKERLAELRKAFEAMGNDPEVHNAAAKERLQLNFMSGLEIQALVRQYRELPPDVVDSMKQTIREAKRGTR